MQQFKKDKPATETTQENGNTTTTELPSTSESSTPKSNSVLVVEGKILILMAVFLLIKTRKTTGRRSLSWYDNQ
jgi:hypothetical protein